MQVSPTTHTVIGLTQLAEDPSGVVACHALVPLQLRRKEPLSDHIKKEVWASWYVHSGHQQDFFARLCIEQVRGNLPLVYE